MFCAALFYNSRIVLLCFFLAFQIGLTFGQSEKDTSTFEHINSLYSNLFSQPKLVYTYCDSVLKTPIDSVNHKVAFMSLLSISGQLSGEVENPILNLFEAKDITDNTKDPIQKGKAQAHLIRGLIHFNSVDIAESVYLEFHELMIQQNNIKLLHFINSKLVFKLNEEMKLKKAQAILDKCSPLVKETNDSLILGEEHNLQGIIHMNNYNYDKSLYNFNEALKMFQFKNDSFRIMVINSNIAVVHSNLGNYEKSLAINEIALRYATALKADRTITTLNINMGVQYGNLNKLALQNDSLEVALNYTKKSWEKYSFAATSASKSGNFIGEIMANSNIASLLVETAEMLLYQQSEVQNFQNFETSELNNPSFLLDSAELYVKKAFQLSQKYNSSHSMSYILSSMAGIAQSRKNYVDAIEKYKELADFTLSRNELSMYRQTCQKLAICYETIYDFENALKYQKIQSQYQDTLFQKDKKEEIGRLNAEIEYSKQLLDKDREILKSEQEKKKRNIIIIFTCIAILVVLVFLYFLKKRLNITKRQNAIIHAQKLQVDAKNKTITDSINYAKRIQAAVLPNIKTTGRIESFVYYQPKDIVSGDFYWTHNTGNLSFFCVADCTGHGVPGAFMSMLGTTMLDQIVKQGQEHNVGKILTHLNTRIIEKLNTNKDNKDGMDIIVGVLNTTTKLLSYSGANNAIFHVRKHQLSELKTDTAFIGDISYQNFEFNVQTLQLNSGDILYLSTDGYRDQKGGEDNGKFYKKRFKDLLLEISIKPLEDQKQLLEEQFISWKGYKEQIDDVCVMGIKIN